MRTPATASRRRALKAAWTSAVFAAIAAFETTQAQGGAFGLYEVGLPNQGESYAGGAATADNAGTAYLNPAGMMRLYNTQLLFGPELFDLQAHFHPGPGTTVSGSDGGEAGGLYGLLGTYLVADFKDDYRLGLSINSPFAYAIDYENNWAGRYFIQGWKLETVDIRPSFACRVDDKLSVAAGADVYYANNYERIALNNSADGLPDGQYNITAEDWRLGWDLGALYELTPGTRIGATYRSKVEFTLKGTPQYQNAGPTLGSTLDDSRYDSNFPLPQGVNVSFYHDFSPRFALLLDFGWTDWSAFDNTPTTLDATPTTVPRDWHDTYRGGIGARYRFAEKWLLQSGYSYDSSPVSDANRTPDLPADEQHRISVGLQHELNKNITLGAAYTFAHFGSAPIDRTLDPSSGNLQGSYSPNQVQVLSLTFSFGF